MSIPQGYEAQIRSKSGFNRNLDYIVFLGSFTSVENPVFCPILGEMR